MRLFGCAKIGILLQKNKRIAPEMLQASPFGLLSCRFCCIKGSFRLRKRERRNSTVRLINQRRDRRCGTRHRPCKEAKSAASSLHPTPANALGELRRLHHARNTIHGTVLPFLVDGEYATQKLVRFSIFGKMIYEYCSGSIQKNYSHNYVKKFLLKKNIKRKCINLSMYGNSINK